VVSPSSQAGLGGRTRRGDREARLFDLAGRLTERDRTICRLLYEHRVLTTSEIADVGFASLRKAQERMALLHRLEVADRFRPRSWAGTGPYHHILGPAGAAVIAAERGVEVRDLAWRRDAATALAASQRLGHLVATNGFFTALIRTSRRHPGSELAEWWSERRCAAAWGQVVRPDGYGVWVEDDRRLPFLLEYDCGTERLARLQGKLPGYARLARAAKHPTWVLFCFTSPAREAAARKVLRHPVVPVATAVLPKGTSPDRPLWLAFSDTSRRRLVDLGHPSRALGTGTET
jgi:hypothetical protein